MHLSGIAEVAPADDAFMQRSGLSPGKTCETMLLQNTYVWELTHSTNFPWLNSIMAEELRNNIEALRLLDQEQNQVRGSNPFGSCFEP